MVDSMRAPETPEILLVVVDAGGGHRAAANALLAAAERTGFPCRLTVVSLQSVLDRLDVSRWLTGRPMEETYNVLLRGGGSRLMVPLLRLLHLSIAALKRPVRRRLAEELAARRPAAVVSLAPNFNAPLRDAVRRALPGVPFIILLTDYADFPPHFWIEAGVDRVIVGSERAVEQARRAGLPAERISLSSGMILHPRFYPRSGKGERTALRSEMGIGPHELVILLLFGGMGAREMEPLAEDLLARDPAWRVIAICGRNPSLLERMEIRAESASGRLHAVGFTDRVPGFLAASDVLVTKPGPGSLAEALHQHVPVVVVRDAHTIPQERFNTDMITAKNLGVVVHRFDQIPGVVAALARDPSRREAILRAHAALPENRAVFDALAIIAKEVEARIRTEVAP